MTELRRAEQVETTAWRRFYRTLSEDDLAPWRAQGVATETAVLNTWIRREAEREGLEVHPTSTPWISRVDESAWGATAGVCVSVLVKADPDPRYVAPVEPVSRIRTCRRCTELLVGPRARRSGVCDDCVGRGGSAIAWIGLIVTIVALGAVIALLMLAFATPRYSVDATAPVEPTEPSSDGPEVVGVSGSLGASPFVPPAVASPPQTQLGTALEAGWATWCAETATKCKGWNTRYVGAVQSFTHGDEPYGVQVCLLEDPATCTHVVVVSHCACGDRGGEATVIDLSPPAFRELAPQSRGVIRVTVEGPIPVPDRPAMTLPATDQED